MAYTRPCNKCGQRISLREMPHGQWVAFDVSTEETHVCGVQHEPDVAVKLKGKNKSRTKEDESIDLGYENENNSNDISEDEADDNIEEEKTYDSTSGIHHCINKAIKEKKRIFIDYFSEYKGENTSREISPIKKFKYKNRNYLQAYCHKRKAERNFLTKAIETATEVDKQRTNAKVGKPKTQFLKKVIETEENTIKAEDLDKKKLRRTASKIANKEIENRIQDKYPARSTIQVAGLPMGASVEIECLG